MNITEEIKRELLILNQKYIDSAQDKYDFWNMHIKYVVKEAVELAKIYNADVQIVELGALLHDIALVAKVGTKQDHHLSGAKLAKELLQQYNYPEEKLNKVLGCVVNHRSSKNAKNIEELCVADADILAHFNDISASFVLGVQKFNYTKPEQFIEWFEKDFNDLSERTKETFKGKYNKIMQVLFADKWKPV